MKRCPKCNVNFNTERKTCCLCFELLEEIDDKELEYPVYPKIKNVTKKKDLFIKILNFLTFLSILITGIINLVTYKKETGFWFLYVTVSVGYCYVLIKSSILSRSNSAKKLVIQMITISFLTLAIDYLSSNTGWALNYVVPLLSVVLSFVIVIILMVNHIKYSEYIFYLMTSLFLGAIPFILWIFKIVGVLWPSLVAFCFSIVVIFGMVFFANKVTKEEFKKKFHI